MPLRETARLLFYRLRPARRRKRMRAQRHCPVIFRNRPDKKGRKAVPMDHGREPAIKRRGAAPGQIFGSAARKLRRAERHRRRSRVWRRRAQEPGCQGGKFLPYAFGRVFRAEGKKRLRPVNAFINSARGPIQPHPFHHDKAGNPRKVIHEVENRDIACCRQKALDRLHTITLMRLWHKHRPFGRNQGAAFLSP